MTISWPLSRQQVLDASGRPLLIPRAFFYAAGTTQPLTVYADAALSVPLTQPVEADGTGRFPRVYLPPVLYREQIVGPYGDSLWSDDGLGEASPTDTTDPVATIDPTAIAVTGDVKWRLDGSIQPGWVRLNGRTIGGSGSGATELADISARALFVYLWSTFADTVASVVGGRGTAAADDFAAGKQITIPSMQGFIAAGLDDMGSTATYRLQWATNLTLTEGSATATVADASRVALGMFVLGDGLSAGTQVVGLNGSTIALSHPAAAGSTGTIIGRFSLFGDAQMPGSTGGDFVEALTNLNLPVALPGGTATYDPPGDSVATYQTLATLAFGDGGTTTRVTGIWQNTQAHNFDPPQTQIAVTNTNPSGGVPISTLQPTRLGTYYLKI